MAYRQMLYRQITTPRYGQEEAWTSSYPISRGCRRCPYSKISRAHAIAWAIGCIVSSTNILWTPTFLDIFDNQLLPFMFNPQKKAKPARLPSLHHNAVASQCRWKIQKNSETSACAQGFYAILIDEQIEIVYFVTFDFVTLRAFRPWTCSRNFKEVY